MYRNLGVVFGLLLLVALGGCASTQPHMIPTPAVMKHPDLDFAPRLPPALRSTELPIFYATTRFHAPVHAAEWNDPGLDAVFDDLWRVIIRGLMADRPGRKKTAA